MTQTYTDSRVAFEVAIQLGLLSADATRPNYAGRYMYMFTDAERGHAFKHVDTRKYVYTFD